MHYKRWKKHGDPTVTVVQPRKGRICSVDGCETAVLAKGWCEKHYARWRTHGDPTVTKKGGPVAVPLDQRYEVNPETGCWEFVGYRNDDGYGMVRYRGQLVYAHRLAGHLWKGFALDSPLFVLHSCDNPPCINPEHLREGTRADNARDMVERGRQFIPAIAGEQHWNSRLSVEDVEHIYDLVASGASQSSVARAYGVVPSVISRIVNGKAWTST